MSFDFSAQRRLESPSTERVDQQSLQTSPSPSLTPSPQPRPQTPRRIFDNLAADVSGLSLSSSGFFSSRTPSPSPSVSSKRDPSNSAITSRLARPDDHSESQEQPLQVRNMGNSSSALVLSEPLPRHRFFEEAYQELLRKGKKLAEDCASGLQECAEVDPVRAGRLVERAQALAKPDLLDTRTIAILGDSGEGKSSLINSLLNCPGLSRTGDVGEACTSVVTEFRFKPNDGASQFFMEVEYLTKSEIDETIKELLWNYRHIHLPDVSEAATSVEEYARLEREREVAWSALRAAFGHRGEQQLKNLCDQIFEGAYDDAAEKLATWADELEWPDSGTNGKYQYSASTAEECSEKAEYFMDDRFWPFTKVIRIFTNSAVLENGVIIVDLPGLRDTNLARVKATEDYLLKADYIFLVASIKRAVSNQSLKSSLYLLRRHIPNEWEEHGTSRLRVTIICTHAEDMNLNDMKKEFVVKRKMLDARTIDDLENRMKAADRGSDTKVKKQLKNELRRRYMRARNDYITSNLRRVYAEETKGNSLEVLCVSNSMYQKALAKFDSTAMMASNVPAVRQHCYSLVADARLAESKNFLLSTLPGLLESVDLWHQNLGQPQRILETALSKALKKKQDFGAQVQSAISETEKTLKELFSDQISKMMEVRHSYWDEEALVRSEDWAAWHWASYKAFVRNDGTHTTAAVGHRRWNNEMLWKMREELQFSWNLVEEEILAEFQELKERIKAQINELANSVETLEALARTVRLQAGDVEFQIGLAERSALELTRRLRRKASEDSYTSFILGAMLPAYREAAQISGGSLLF